MMENIKITFILIINSLDELQVDENIENANKKA